MEKTIADVSELKAGKSHSINIDKLHAALCILASAASSIALIAWLMKALA